MLHELRHRFARWLAYRQTLASLRRLPDSILADAGLSREEIRERARDASLRRDVREFAVAVVQIKDVRFAALAERVFRLVDVVAVR